MFSRIFLTCFLLFFVSSLSFGQPTLNAAAGSNTASAAEPDKAGTPDTSSRKGWRDTSNYPFPALADTVAAVQNMVQATALSNYCANKKLPDDFVRGRLALFSRITGREEDCQSVLDYMR